MSLPRLLTILGPASVLYVLAARASSSTTSSPEWLVASVSLAFSLTPLAVAGARPSRHGASRLAIMGVSLALALASIQSLLISPTKSQLQMEVFKRLNGGQVTVTLSGDSDGPFFDTEDLKRILSL